MTTTEAAATTEAVLNHHLTAFADKDMSEILSDYTDESVVVTNIGTFHGVEEIEGLFDDMFAEFSQEGVTMEVTQQTIEDEYAFIVWEAETPDNVYEFATDTFHVVDEEIHLQTFAGKITPKG